MSSVDFMATDEYDPNSSGSKLFNVLKTGVNGVFDLAKGIVAIIATAAARIFLGKHYEEELERLYKEDENKMRSNINKDKREQQGPVPKSGEQEKPQREESKEDASKKPETEPPKPGEPQYNDFTRAFENYITPLLPEGLSVEVAECPLNADKSTYEISLMMQGDPTPQIKFVINEQLLITDVTPPEEINNQIIDEINSAFYAYASLESVSYVVPSNAEIGKYLDEVLKKADADPGSEHVFRYANTELGITNVDGGDYSVSFKTYSVNGDPITGQQVVPLQQIKSKTFSEDIKNVIISNMSKEIQRFEKEFGLEPSTEEQDEEHTQSNGEEYHEVYFDEADLAYDGEYSIDGFDEADFTDGNGGGLDGISEYTDIYADDHSIID